MAEGCELGGERSPTSTGCMQHNAEVQVVKAAVGHAQHQPAQGRCYNATGGADSAAAQCFMGFPCKGLMPGRIPPEYV